jgi:hypothetical protein
MDEDETQKERDVRLFGERRAEKTRRALEVAKQYGFLRK